MMYRIGTKNVDYTFSEDGEILVMNWDTDTYEEPDCKIKWALQVLREEGEDLPDEDEMEVVYIEVDFSGNVWLHIEE